MESKPLNKLAMIVCAAMVGIIVSLSVILFIKLFALVHNLFFINKISFFYNEKVHTPSGLLGFGIIFVPVIGSLFVTWLIERFAANERGLSVPAIIYSIHFNEGKVRPIPAFAKAIASIISIGSGGSLGREGPIVQLSAAFSAIVGLWINLSPTEKCTLIAAGAAAGTAVVFNSPLAALVFVVEILLGTINFFSISLIVTAEIVALFVSRYFLGDFSIFSFAKVVIAHDIFLKQLLILLPFGIALGIISTIFIRGIYLTEDFFVKNFKNPYLRHATGMFLVGIMLYILMFFFGHYYIEGVGFATINDALNFIIKNPWLLSLILLFKLLATFFTLGSGASGGVFSPILFIGALLGAMWTILGSVFGMNVDLNTTYVIAGMAGMLAGVTGGIITSIILCIEITKDYQQIIPILMTTTVAYLTRIRLCEHSVYTLKLKRNKIDYSQ